MQIVRLHYPLDPNRHFKTPVSLAMGFFDGVHLGHQRVIEIARQAARKQHLALAVLTYNHYPALVYKKLSYHDRRYLTLWPLKLRLFKQLGVQIVYLVDYTYRFQAQSPQEFVDNYLLRLNAKVLVAGFDHTYGPRAAANMKTLPKYVRNRSRVITVSPDLFGHRKISSTRIRRDLDLGRLQTVNRLLNRQFQTTGLIVHGYARGRKLGFPTINVEHSVYQWLPAVGVYLVKVEINRRWYDGVASIGHNVTFGNYPLTVEIYLLDFHQMVYGETVKINWLRKVRNQIKFGSSTQLVKQLKIDVLNARKLFHKNS